LEKRDTARQPKEDNVIRHKRFAWWITKTTDTHLEYALLMAFQWQQWFCKGTSVLRYTYTTSLFNIIFLYGYSSTTAIFSVYAWFSSL